MVPPLGESFSQIRVRDFCKAPELLGTFLENKRIRVVVPPAGGLGLVNPIPIIQQNCQRKKYMKLVGYALEALDGKITSNPPHFLRTFQSCRRH